MQADLPAGEDIQLENGGWFRLHAKILEVLAVARFTAAEFRAINFLLRQTYGYHKKEDSLSLSKWAEGTNTDRCNMSHILDGLIAKNVIYRTPGKGQMFTYGFNKYVENWDPSIFERDSDRAHRFKEKPTVVQPDNSVQPDNCCTPRQQTVVQPDNKTVVQPDTHKSIRNNTFKNKESAQPKPKSKPKAPPKPRDERLDHPAVVMYRDFCKLMPNDTQRGLICESITDLTKWRETLTFWMGCSYKPGNVIGMIDRYQHGAQPQAPNRSNGRGPTNYPGSIASEANREANRKRQPADRTPRVQQPGPPGNESGADMS